MEPDAPVRRSRRWLLWGLALAACLSLIGWVVVRGDARLRSDVRALLANQLSGLLQGELRLGQVSSLSLGKVVVTDATVLDPQGRVVLRGQRLEVDFDLWALLAGKVRLTRSRLVDADITLYPGVNQSVSLFEALTPMPSDGTSVISVHFESIAASRVRVHGDVPGLAGIEVRDVAARGRIDITNTIRVQVFSVRGMVVRPFGVPLGLAAGNFALVGEPLHLTGVFRIERKRERARARLSYTGRTDALSLEFALEPLSTTTLDALHLGAPSTLLGDVAGAVRLDGARGDWRFRAALRSNGGPLGIVGRHNRAGHTQVTVTSEGLDLSQLFAYAPPVRVAATVHAQAEPEGRVLLQAVSPGVEAFGLTFDRVLAVGSYERGTLTLPSASFYYAGGRFDVTGYVRADSDFSLRVRSVVPEVARDRALRREGVRARLDTDLTFTQTKGLLAAEGRADLRRFSYHRVSAETLHVEGRASGAFDKPDVQLKVNGTGLAIAGYPVGQGDLSITGSGGIYRTDFHLRDALGRDARARVRVEDRSHALRIVADPLTLSVPNRPAWRAQADIVLDDDGVDIRHVLLESGEQHLDLEGRWSYSRAYRVDGKLVRFDLGGLRELLAMDLADLDGTVDGTLSLTGVPGQPRIHTKATLTGGQFLGMQGLAAKLDMVFLQGRFDAQGELVLPDKSRLALVLGGQPGRGRSWVDQVTAGNYELGIDFVRVPFAVSRPWLAWLGLSPPPGTVSANIRSSGPLRAPAIDAIISVHGVELAPWPALDIELSLSHHNETLQLRKLSVADAHGEVGHAEGRLRAKLSEFSNPIALRRSLATRDLEFALSWPKRELTELPGPLQMELPASTSGSLTITQTDLGPLLELDGRLQLSTIFRDRRDRCGAVQLPDLKVTAKAQGNQASASLDGFLSGGQLMQAQVNADVPVSAWLTGAVPITKPRTSGKLVVRTDAAEELPLLCLYAMGPVELEITVQDAFSDPPLVSFLLRSPALQLIPHESQRTRLGTMKVTQTVGRPFSVDLRGGVEHDHVSFVGHLGADPGSSMDIFGAIPRAAFGPRKKGADIAPLELRLRMRNMELARLLLALPIGLRAGATMNGETRISYDLDDDRLGLEGKMSLTDGSLAVPMLGQQFSQLRADLTMSGNRVVIERFSTHDFEGQLAATGEWRFDTLHHSLLQLELAMTDFPVRREGAQVSKLTGKMRLRADIDSERTRAELVVRDLRVDLPNDLGQDIQSLDTHPDITVVGEQRPAPPEHPYVFEARVLATDPPFRIRRTDLSAEVRADVSLRYRDPLLTIQGSAELRRGSFELYGKRFELRDSRLAFAGDDHLDPLVNLVAVHKIGGDEITVRLEGRMSAPKVTFSHSDPRITNPSEIIAALLGGRNADTIQTQRDAAGAATSFLAGATAGLLTEEVRREFGGAIPVLAIESGNQAFRNARIRAGVQLDRLIEKRLGALRNMVRGAYVEGFVAPGADPDSATQYATPQSRGGGLLELRFPADFLGSVEYRPVQNWRIDIAWEP